MATDEFGNYTAGIETAGKSIDVLDGDGSPNGVLTPTVDEAIYVDNLTMNRWQWRDSAWSLITMPVDTLPT